MCYIVSGDKIHGVSLRAMIKLSTKEQLLCLSALNLTITTIVNTKPINEMVAKTPTNLYVSLLNLKSTGFGYSMLLTSSPFDVVKPVLCKTWLIFHLTSISRAPLWIKEMLCTIY